MAHEKEDWMHIGMHMSFVLYASIYIYIYLSLYLPDQRFIGLVPLCLNKDTKIVMLCPVYISWKKKQLTTCMHKIYSQVLYNYTRKSGLKGTNRLILRRVLINWSNSAALWMKLKLFALKTQKFFELCQEKKELRQVFLQIYIHCQMICRLCAKILLVGS